ncbi:MAG: amidohydrolase family protein [Lactobacillaceae bacterium]|jgi:imidazolonepropionase-like amidohydrolase|nr:amidohydrolase family protein [Lactobacillaceae bacterium]
MTTILFKGGHVFTGLSTEFETLDILADTETGRIITVAPELHEADQIVDTTDRYIIPGLINAHTHIVFDPFARGYDATSETNSTVLALQNLADALHDGVTYIRDLGSIYEIDLKLSALEKAGKVLIPGIVGSGSAVVMTGGHGVSIGIEADGPDATRKAARTVIKHGAKNVKLMATGGVSVDGEKPTDIQLGEDELRAAVEEAHKKGYTAAAHAQGTEGIKNAIRAGVDSIEHAVYLDDEAIEMMLANQTTIVPTLEAPIAINNGAEHLPTWMVEKSQEVTVAHWSSIRRAVQAGVKIAMGTDSGTPYNTFRYASTLEVADMVEAGMTPVQALLASTKAGAELLHITEDAGTLQVGRLADLVILPADPLADITQLQGAKTVYKKAQLIK